MRLERTEERGGERASIARTQHARFVRACTFADVACSSRPTSAAARVKALPVSGAGGGEYNAEEP